MLSQHWSIYFLTPAILNHFPPLPSLPWPVACACFILGVTSGNFYFRVNFINWGMKGDVEVSFDDVSWSFSYRMFWILSEKLSRHGEAGLPVASLICLIIFVFSPDRSQKSLNTSGSCSSVVWTTERQTSLCRSTSKNGGTSSMLLLWRTPKPKGERIFRIGMAHVPKPCPFLGATALLT